MSWQLRGQGCWAEETGCPLPEEILMLKQCLIKWDWLSLLECIVGSERGTEIQLCPARYNQWDTMASRLLIEIQCIQYWPIWTVLVSTEYKIIIIPMH